MKVFLSLFLLAVTSAYAADNCYSDVGVDCGRESSNLILQKCNALYGGYHHNSLAREMQAYANLHLQKSFDYLLSSAYYNNYQTNRVGFHKLFKKLSDDTWAKTIDLIKHMTLRGGVMDFTQRSTQDVKKGNYTVELYELESLASALDSEKELAERAFFIHREATRNSEHLHDAEIAQYLEEEFIEYQSKSVRDLAGYTSDLKKFISNDEKGDMALALYVFDEYLQKAV